MAAAPPLTLNAVPLLPVSVPLPRFTGPPPAPVSRTPFVPLLDDTDVKPVNVASLVNVALVVIVRPWPLVLIATSRTLSVPTAPPVIAVVELPTAKPARVLPEPSVMAVPALVMATVVPLGLI